MLMINVTTVLLFLVLITNAFYSQGFSDLIQHHCVLQREAMSHPALWSSSTAQLFPPPNERKKSLAKKLLK